MEAIRELVPFLFGLILPLPLAFALRPKWSGVIKSLIILIVSVVIGATASFVVGELADELPEAFRAIVMDSCLVYTGSQVAYRFFWKPVLQNVLHQPQKVA